MSRHVLGGAPTFIACLVLSLALSPPAAIAATAAPGAPAMAALSSGARTSATEGEVRLQYSDGGFFLSPSRNISCELDNGRLGLHQVYCQTISAPRSVTLSVRGALHVCTGVGCLGNPPDNAIVLAYGEHTVVGPFVCASTTEGITCTVSTKGGFRISRSGVVAVKSSLCICRL